MSAEQHGDAAGSAENSVSKQRGKPFRKGQSGNPAGKPKGSLNRVTRAVEALLNGEAKKLTRKCIERALEGDSTALRLCMERIAPLRKGRPISLKLPPIATTDDLVKAVASLVQAVGTGVVTPDEGATVATILEVKRKAIETQELDRRVAALEAKGDQK